MGKAGSRYHVMKGMFSCLHKLEALSADWPGKVRHYEKILFSGGRKKYKAPHRYRMPDKIAEQLLSYFIYVYFAGAVYDGMPYSKKSNWPSSAPCSSKTWSAPKQQKKGQLSFEAIAEAAHSYAREVEHPTLISNACLSCSDTGNASISDACAVHYSNGRGLR